MQQIYMMTIKANKNKNKNVYKKKINNADYYNLF